MSESKFHTYKCKVRLGSMPDHTEWWTDEDYRQHEEYVNRLKESGDYLKEVEVSITMMDCDIFGKSNKDEPLYESYRLEILNFE